MRAVVLALTLVLASPATSSLDRHDAKVRAFKALLHITELPPDAGDATHAAITLESCARTSFGFRCTGSLAPVSFSGIDGSTCHYVIYVTPHRTRIPATDC